DGLTHPLPHHHHQEIISDLQSGKRTILGLGLANDRFLAFIGNSNRERNPSDIYVFSPPLSSVQLDSLQPKVTLENGGPLSAKYPSIFSALRDHTVRNRTVVISDASD